MPAGVLGKVILVLTNNVLFFFSFVVYFGPDSQFTGQEWKGKGYLILLT